MSGLGPGGIAGWLRALVEASHPFPVAAVLALTALVGLASAETLAGFDWGRLGGVTGAMLLSQLSIGWTNDYVDRRSDALHQPAKPVAAGRLNPAKLPALALLTALGSIALAAVSFSAMTLVWFVIGTSAGLLYDLRIKDTPVSWLPYVVAFVVLPPYVWSAMDSFRGEFLLLYPVALPLAVAVHLGNSLPDIETDRAADRRGIAVTIGPSAGLALLYASLVTSLVLALASLLWLSYQTTLLAGTLAAYIGLELVATCLYFVRPFATGARLAFRPLALGCVVFVAGLVAAL